MRGQATAFWMQARRRQEDTKEKAKRLQPTCRWACLSSGGERVQECLKGDSLQRNSGIDFTGGPPYFADPLGTERCARLF